MELSTEQKQKYLTRRENDLRDCFTAIESKDVPILARIGHQMKGNAITFGFDPLSKIGQDLEDAARACDWAKVEAAVSQFKKYLSETPVSSL